MHPPAGSATRTRRCRLQAGPGTSAALDKLRELALEREVHRGRVRRCAAELVGLGNRHAGRRELVFVDISWKLCRVRVVRDQQGWPMQSAANLRKSERDQASGLSRAGTRRQKTLTGQSRTPPTYPAARLRLEEVVRPEELVRVPGEPHYVRDGAEGGTIDGHRQRETMRRKTRAENNARCGLHAIVERASSPQ